MKGEIGQYIRTTTGKIWQINIIWKDGVKAIWALSSKNGNWTYIERDLEYDYGTSLIFVEKVADTPQELIEVGDLVKYNCLSSTRTRFVGRKDECGWFRDTENDGCIRFKDITKILTPNADKTVYTQQWEQED